MAWNDAPDFDEVRTVLRDLASAKAMLRVAELELQMEQAVMDKAKPRTPYVKIIGIDDESRKRLADLQRTVADARAYVDKLEAESKFLDYRREMYKIASYNGRV